MGWWKTAVGNYINEVVSLNEGDIVSWRIHLDSTSTIFLSVIPQEEVSGVYIYTMEESEFQHFSTGTYRYFPDLSMENVGRFNSGDVSLMGGDYRIVVGLKYNPDGSRSHLNVAVRFEILK